MRPPHPSVSLLACVLVLPFTAPAGRAAPGDERPQLLSTTGGGPRWKTLQELQAFAAKGDPAACFELGARLVEGDADLPADPARARTFLETAARANHADALFRLGKLQHDGVGGERDYAKAFDCYTRAARRGVPEAQHNVGAMFVSARGVKRDYVEGLAWLMVAEKSGAKSDAVQLTRERLKKRPQDIAAAEKRAAELWAALQSQAETIAPRAEVQPSAPGRAEAPAYRPAAPERPKVPVLIPAAAPVLTPDIPRRP